MAEGPPLCRALEEAAERVAAAHRRERAVAARGDWSCAEGGAVNEEIAAAEAALLELARTMPERPVDGEATALRDAKLAPLALAICDAETTEKAAEHTVAYLLARNGAAEPADLAQVATGLRAMADALEVLFETGDAPY